jgi:glutamate-1-semialdehyde 2,1-aminomutase
LFFTSTRVRDYATAKTSDTALFGRYFNAMLERGVYLAPSQYEALFVSAAIDTGIADRILQASDESLKML